VALDCRKGVPSAKPAKGCRSTSVLAPRAAAPRRRCLVEWPMSSRHPRPARRPGLHGNAEPRGVRWGKAVPPGAGLSNSRTGPPWPLPRSMVQPDEAPGFSSTVLTARCQCRPRDATPRSLPLGGTAQSPAPQGGRAGEGLSARQVANRASCSAMWPTGRQTFCAVHRSDLGSGGQDAMPQTNPDP
jgi:hypothetical protein